MNSRLVQAVSLALLIGLIYGASRFSGQINAGREKLNTYGQTNIQASTPPEYAFAIQAFGAFRGLLTDIAFIRAESLKSDGRYYDAMQLASWICKMQPRFPSVWEFQAWNMAWNISVTTYTPEERWNWVYNGVKLLRDEGIVYNPRAVNLYKQLAWTFNNKMSENVDEYHKIYKRNWAWKMHLVLGAPPDPLGDYRPDKLFESVDKQLGADKLAEVSRREKEVKEKAKEDWQKEDPTYTPTAEKVNTASRPVDDPALLNYRIVKRSFYNFIKKIDDAPATLPALFEKAPGTREMIAALRGMGIKLSDDVLNEDDFTAANGLERTFFLRYRKLLEGNASLNAELSRVRPDDPDLENINKLGEILGLKAHSADGELLVRYLQRKVLREVYKLKTDQMAELIARFGPLDWRVVDAHSLYWVSEGLIAGGETVSKIGNDKTNTARLIFFSLRNLFHRNRLTFEPNFDDVNGSYINYSPDLNFIEPMHEAFFTYGPLIDPEPTTTGAGGTFKTGHVNFLIESIQLLYFSGRETEANRYFNYLKTNYNLNDDGSVNLNFSVSLDQFVQAQLNNSFESENDMRNAINGLIAYSFDALSNGDIAHYNLYKRQYEAWHNTYNNQTQAKPDLDRIRMAPVSDLQADILRELLRAPPISPLMMQRKQRLWTYAQIEPGLRQSVYDDVKQALIDECTLWNYDVAKAFPEPEGMQQWRIAHPPRKRVEEEKKNIETPAQNVQ